MQCIHFILLQGFIIFHREITFAIGPDESFGRSISLHRAPPRPQTEAGTGAAQTIIIQVAPPRLPTEAAARAQRRLLYKPCPRRVPLRGMRSETKGSAPQRAATRRRAVGERQAPPAAGVPVEGAGVPVVVDVVGEGAAGTGVPAGVPVEGGAGTGVPAGVPVEGGAGTGVPGGVTAEPAAEEPVEGAGAPGVAPPVGEPPCCALAPCFFLSRCTKLTA